MRKIKKITIATTLCMLIGCGGQSSSDIIDQGIKSLEAGNISAAEIEFKKALQKSPDNASARFMLGRLYSESGSSLAAQKELEMTLRLGYDTAQVYRYLAPVYYRQTDGAGLDSLLAKADSLPDEVLAIVLAFDGMLDLEMGEPEGNIEQLNQLKEVDLDGRYYKLLEVYSKFANNKFQQAVAINEDLIAKYPDMPEAHFVLGQLYSVLNQMPLAVKEFESYHQFRPEDFRGAIYLANAYVKTKQFDKAQPYISKFLEINPAQAFVNFLNAIILYDNDNLEKAKLAAEKAIQNGFDRTPARVIAGLSAFRLENYEQAYNHLDAIKDSLPSESPVLALLSALNIKLGYTENLADIFGKKTELSDNDILLLSTATVDLVRAGNLEKASESEVLLESAQTENELSLVAKGMARLSLEDLDGITDLEAALSFSPESEIANSALANAYIGQKMFPEAIALAKKWQQAHPEAPYGYNLEGLALIEQGKRQEAEVSFKLALELDENDPLANNFFAELAKQDGNVELAITHFKAILKKHPTHQVALTKLFDIYLETKNTTSGFEFLQIALDNASDSNRQTLNLLYSKALYATEQYQKMVDFLVPLNHQAMPAQYWIYLSNAYLQLGQVTAALDVSKNWTKVQPDLKLAWLRYVTLMDDTGRKSEALQVARRALSKFQDPTFNLLVTDLAVKSGDVRLARTSFSKLPERDRLSALGLLLDGELKLLEGHTDEGLVLLEKSFSMKPSDRAIWLIAKTLIQRGEADKAYARYESYVDWQYASTRILKQLAELAILNSDYERAVDVYAKALEKSPDDLIVLNNLANILIEIQKPELAVKYSYQAFEMVGGANATNIAVIDTYATALWKAKKYNDSIKLFEQIYRLQPSNERKLASVLNESGETDKSQKLLDLIN